MVVLFGVVDHLHLEMVKHLGALELWLDELLGKDDVAQVSHEICVNPHLYKLGLWAENINELDAHSLDIKWCILAQIKQNLEPIHIKKFAGKLTWTITLMIAFIKKQDFE